MDNIAGTPVEGENFFAREADIERIQELLDNHDVLLLGARRIGKTSIARAVMHAVRSDGWRAIEINVASCSDESQFLSKLDTALRPELASIADKAKAALADTLDVIANRVKNIKVSIPGTTTVDVGLASGTAEDWVQVANDLLRLIAKAHDRWLIYVDELPIMLYNIIRSDAQGGMQRVRRFLDWFRNDVRAMPEVTTVRWLVSGSVGLDTLVQQHDMADTINSMKHESLEAFSEDVAASMLHKLASRYTMPLSEADAQSLVRAVQWAQPYYLQLAFHHLRGFLAQAPDADMTSLIEQAVDKMVQPGSDNDFHHWERRLAIQLSGPLAGHAHALLEVAAMDAKGARADMLLAKLQERLPDVTSDEARRLFAMLRDILQRDAYWEPAEITGQKSYRFRLEPLRRWWLRRNSL